MTDTGELDGSTNLNKDMWERLSYLYESAIISISHIGLLAIAPIAKAVNKEDLSSSIVTNIEVEQVLKSNGLFEEFMNGKLRCSSCNSVITANTLGMIGGPSGDATKRVDLYCRDPGCTLRSAPHVHSPLSR